MPDQLLSKLVDDIVYEVECQTVTVKPGADVDIGAPRTFRYILMELDMPCN